MSKQKKALIEGQMIVLLGQLMRSTHFSWTIFKKIWLPALLFKQSYFLICFPELFYVI